MRAFLRQPLERLTSLELCAGGGGQALGLEAAGFQHVGLVEIDRHACATLSRNRPHWNVLNQDLNAFDASRYRGIDLLAGGLPCPPFSRAGKQLGEKDNRNLWPAALRCVGVARPKAVMFENVRGILDGSFDEFRSKVSSARELRGYFTEWRLLQASDFGVSQARQRAVFIAIQNALAERWRWPEPLSAAALTVGEALYDLMAAGGWKGVKSWKRQANGIAPTIVGGSHRHGGPDLGPTRARKEWASLGVNGLLIAETAPDPHYRGMPNLTVRMVARLQGFPDDWEFEGGKTASYRQVGNAFPPPVAAAVARRIRDCLTREERRGCP